LDGLVLHAGSTPLTGPDTAGAARRLVRAVVLPLLVLATLPLGAALDPAGADSVASLQSQAATVSHDLVLEQLQVDAARQQTSVAASRVAADEEAMTQLGQQLAAGQQAVAAQLRVVRAQAIRSYINSGASSGVDAALFSGGSARAQAASEYTSLAVGNITTSMARLHTAQQDLKARQAALQASQAQDRADQARRTVALGQASAAAGQLQAEQARVTGQLATAVAAQQAAQDRAAAAAVASAPKVAPRTTAATIPAATATTSGPAAPVSAAPAVTTSSSSSSSGDPYPGLSDPALNGFLSCVVQAESGGNYGISSSNGTYLGAFQFSQPTWNTAAAAAGLPLLVGVPPNRASKAEQDTVAVALFALDGQQPWLGDRC
jgi:hypothetical protein